MSHDTTPPISARGIRIHWADVWRLLTWALPLVLMVAMLYLTTVFATHDQLRQSVAPFESLPPRMEKLEEFKSEQKILQQSTTQTVGQIKEDLAGMRATLDALKAESKSNTDRILQRLDNINVRPARTGEP